MQCLVAIELGFDERVHGSFGGSPRAKGSVDLRQHLVVGVLTGRDELPRNGGQGVCGVRVFARHLARVEGQLERCDEGEV